MFLRRSNYSVNINKPPTSFGGLSFIGSENLPFKSQWTPFVRNFLLLFLAIFFSSVTSAALLMTQPPAVLNWTAATLPVQTNISVLRYEDIGFYRYDPNSSESFLVWEGNFADQDSLTGIPTLLDVLPAPVDSSGNALALNGNIPLAEATAYEFYATEPLFIVAKGPILPPSAFVTRLDGKRYIAVTLAIDGGDSFIITLVETAPNSGDYVGYLQANLPDSPIVIPPGSSISIVYDDYGDVPDSETINAPWFVDPANLSVIQERKQGTMSATPPVTPVYDMFLSKQALRNSVVHGDFLAYELRLENVGNAVLSNVEIVDTLPKGFRYQKSSSKKDGLALSDPLIDSTGENLTFSIGNLLAGEVVTVRYVVEVSVAANIGNAVNTAQARTVIESSNVANAIVSVEQPFFNDRAFLLGRVIVGNCGDDTAQGLAGVRLYMEDGTSVVTDNKGRWHIEGVMPGTHVLQLDTLTLGSRYTLQQCQQNTRQAGNPASRFVNVQGGTLWRENWYINKRWGTDANVEQQLTTTALDSGELSVEVSIRTGDRDFEELLTQFTLPEGVHIVSESVVLDGKSIANFDQKDNVHEITLQPEGKFAKYTLGFALAIDPKLQKGAEGELLAETMGLAASGGIYSVKSKNVLDVKGEKNNDNNIVIRPKFSSMSADLSDIDKANIEPSLKQLVGRENLYLNVVGHSDSQPIKPKAGRAINDNYALSEARAKSVAEYVSNYLKIDMARISIEGKGPDMPIADNKTADGRAKNRRVALEFRFTEKVSDASLGVLEGYSGINTDLDEKVFHVENNLAVNSETGTENKIKKNKAGFVNLNEGMTFVQPVFSATALMEEKLKVQLLINGEEVPAGRIGMKMLDLETGLVRYTWVGLELDQVGDHFIELKGLDSFGNARFEQNINIRLSSQIKTIRLADAGENMADGRSPIKVRLTLLDDSDKPITTQTELKIVSGTLQPLNYSQADGPLESQGNVVIVDADGYVRFEPIGIAGTYQMRLAASDEVYQDIEIPVAPDLREWILVGFAEGTVGYNTLQGNMSNLNDEENHSYSSGDAAFFARGKVKGEWLLTMAYDSRRSETDSPLMQRIDPQRWYVLYGDDAARGHDAPSREKLYLRIEKTDFYALFGDYDSSLTVTELTRYQRSLTGAKVEWKGKNIGATGFAAQTNQGFIRDDIAADGTSGLYRLSRNRIVLGSDEVTIETRDRFTNEVLETQLMTRYVDYTLDAMDGTLYFRQPIFVQDENFNPQRIVVRYEVESGEEELVGGGRVSVYDAEKKLEVGLTAVGDDTVGAEGTLGGVDVTWKPNKSNTLKAEVAGSSQDDISSVTNNSQAGLIDYKYTSEKFDNGVRIEEKEGDFGLGQLAKDDDDIRIVKANTRYRFSEEVVLSGEASHQEMLSLGNERNSAETRIEYLQPEWKAYSGFRHSADTVNEDLFESQHLVAGGQHYYRDRRLLLSARGETSVDHNENVDYPNLLSLGSDYRINNRVSVFANQDFSWGEEQQSQETRLGARATPWKGGTVSSDVSRSQNEYGPRLLAHAGLFQTVPINNQWTADFGVDRSQTLRDDSTPPVAEIFDPRRSLANGTNNDDYTAVSAGAGYRTAEWQWTNRAEFRQADTDDKWTLMSGFQHRLDETDTVAGRVLYFDQRMNNGSESRTGELDFSYSRRPLSESWYWLNRSSLIFDEVYDAFGLQEGQRFVNNSHLNFKFEIRHQLSLQYGARYVRESIDDLNFKGYSDLIGSEYRYDITERWDVGLRGSTLASYNSDIRYNAFGVMAGYTPIKDVWVSLGYNFQGFYDKDFTDAGTRVKGFVLNFRIKLDQDSARELPEKTRDMFNGDAS